MESSSRACEAEPVAQCAVELQVHIQRVGEEPGEFAFLKGEVVVRRYGYIDLRCVTLCGSEYRVAAAFRVSRRESAGISNHGNQ